MSYTRQLLKQLADLLDEDNQASMALLIRCVAANRQDLLENAATVCISVIKHGERIKGADEIYLEVLKELRK